ncbi:MAG: ABC transporter [Flavobacteriales bacterium]|nr:ABC transporter [Flavobacteriales bacterium]|tara:strand:- start:25532 stop:27307 length:1776 start_codon:yes stop_codon:yes gene_type:complete
MKSLQYLNKYFFKYRFRISIGLVFVVFGNIFALLPAHLIGKSFDLITDVIQKIQSSESLDMNSLYQALSLYAGLLILFAIIRGVLMFYMRQTIIVASRKIEFDLKSEIFNHYLNLSSRFHMLNDSGDLLNRITEDVNRVRMYLGPAVMYSFNLITLIILILTRMLVVSPQLTLFVLAPLPILSFLIYKVSHYINMQSSHVQNKLSKLTNVTQETFSGIRLVKSFVRERDIKNYFRIVSNDYMNQSISLSIINSIFFPLVLLIVGVSILLTVYAGGILVSRNVISVGEVAEFIIYVNMLTWPATSIGWVTEVIQRAAASQARINEFLYNKDYSIFYNRSEDQLKSEFNFNTINFNNLSFKYIDSDILALNNINFSIKKNTITAIVGHVGSGKTTMLKILAGIISPNNGNLLFDEVSHTKFNWFNFRDQIAYVSQDVFLFSNSIKNNILFGTDDATDLEMINIARDLCLLDEIHSFNDGFDTLVGEGGVTLSGGQKQRIALARALVKKPKFLILDDALSNVDSSTEIKIINYIKHELKDTTVILSSNRLSILSCCSNIIVLKSGSIIQHGSHGELIDCDGEYKNLFIHQIDFN